MTSLRGVSERPGFTDSNPERTIWFIGDALEPFEAMAATIAEIGERHSRTEILLSTPDPDLRRLLVDRFPSCMVLPPPFGPAPLARLFLRSRNVRVAVFLEPRATPSAALLAMLQRMAIATIAVANDSNAALALGQPLNKACEAIIQICGNMTGAEVTDGRRRKLTAARFSVLLSDMLARDLKPLRQVASLRRMVGARLLTLAEHPRWRRLIAWRLNRYATVAELDKELGRPGAIMCLGNGPSSEDPTLDGMDYDVLFRVNHSWLKRGKFIEPDVVFTGGKTTMRALDEPILGVQSRYAEERCAEIRALAPTLNPGRFFSANSLCPEIVAFPWGGLRPTNGASMLSVAVALQPTRLIVAGIDLFQHAAGSYPGDTATPNAYSPGHSRETELAFLLKILTNYRGELVIIGDVLRAEWEKFSRKTQRPQLTS